MNNRTAFLIVLGVIALIAMFASPITTNATALPNSCEDYRWAWNVMKGLMSFAPDPALLPSQPISGGSLVFFKSTDSAHLEWAGDVNRQMVRKFGKEFDQAIPATRTEYRHLLEKAGWRLKPSQPYNSFGQMWEPSDKFTPPCLPPPAGPKALEGWVPEQLVTVTAPPGWNPLDARQTILKPQTLAYVFAGLVVVACASMFVFARAK